jgi:hypothetical protein
VVLAVTLTFSETWNGEGRCHNPIVVVIRFCGDILNARLRARAAGGASLCKPLATKNIQSSSQKLTIKALPQQGAESGLQRTIRHAQGAPRCLHLNSVKPR